MDRRWGGSHRDAYRELMGGPTGKVKVDSKEQAQIGKERGHSRHFGSSDRAVSDKQYYISKQERLTHEIEKDKKIIRKGEALKAAGKISSEQLKALEYTKKAVTGLEKKRDIAVQKAKDAAAGKDVGGPVSTRKKAKAEQEDLERQQVDVRVTQGMGPAEKLVYQQLRKKNPKAPPLQVRKKALALARSKGTKSKKVATK